MTVSVIIVGIGDWERYTRPAIDSILAFEPEVNMHIVDNGDQYPAEYRGVNILHVMPILSYAGAINAGIMFCQQSDYYVILNNDILCTGAFVDMVEQQGKNTIAANTLNFRGNYGWIDGWHYCIPHNVWQVVGQFDEGFKVAAFEDADYTIRAQAEGVKIEKAYHPFEHLWAHNRYTQSKFWEQREANRKYLIKKHPQYRKVFDGYN